MKEYPIKVDFEFGYLDLYNIAWGHRKEGMLFSARLSTGLFGLHNCKAGNRGPKNNGEIILYGGAFSINNLIKDGFVPCPVCKPEKSDMFWDFAKDPLKSKYNFSDIKDFANKDKLGFDPRRLDWDDLLGTLGCGPGRIYLPKDLPNAEVQEFRGRYNSLLEKNWAKKFGEIAFPKLGYYDHTSKTRFTEYN